MSDYIKGIDISAIQGTNIDWNKLFSNGYQFIIHRCGIGNSGIDKCYTTNIANAKQAGLKVAAYNFLYPLPTIPSQPLRDAKLQAQYHYKATNGELCFVDLEWPYPQDWSKWSCSASQISQWLLDYLQEYERLDGRKPVIYTYPSFAQSLKLSSDFNVYQLWIASYTTKPAVPEPWNDWSFWQINGGDIIDGIPVKVDCDLAKDLSLWGAVAQPSTDPVPDHQPAPAPDPAVVESTQPAASPPPAPAIQPIVSPASGNILNTIWNAVSGLFKGK